MGWAERQAAREQWGARKQSAHGGDSAELLPLCAVRVRMGGGDHGSDLRRRVLDLERVMYQLVEASTLDIDPETAMRIEKIRRRRRRMMDLDCALQAEVRAAKLELTGLKQPGKRGGWCQCGCAEG